MPRWRPKKTDNVKPTNSYKPAPWHTNTDTTDISYYAKWLIDNREIDKIDKVLSWIEILAQWISQQNENLNKMIEIMLNSKAQPVTEVSDTEIVSENNTTNFKNTPEVAQEVPYYDWMLELHDTWWVIPSNAVNIGTSKSPEYLKELFEKNYKGKSYQLNNWQKFFIKGFRVQRV